MSAGKPQYTERSPLSRLRELNHRLLTQYPTRASWAYLQIMALIDCASWKPKSDSFVFAYRYPETNLSTYTQLIVYESQEALLVSKGRLMAKFGAGKHTLNTENIPLLRELFGIPFDGKNPFTAEVWIINKLYPANLGWVIDNIPVHDPDYQTLLPLSANGQYGLQVSDSEKFLIKMVGTKDVFTERDMLSQAYGEFSSKTKSAIIQFMTQQRIGYKLVSGHLSNLSDYIKANITSFWQEYGLTLTKFYVNNIAIDTSTAEGRKISEALASQASMSITGHSWQQEQMFGTMNNAVDQMGNGQGGNGLLAGIMAMNMMGGTMGGGVGAGMMQTHNNQPTFGGNQGGMQGMQGGMQGMQGMPGGVQQPQQVKEVYCANCSKKHLSTERFCPHCGSEYHPCPRCGSDNPPTARRCVSCGTPLQSASGVQCPQCGTAIAPGTQFCPQCGSRVTMGGSGNSCPRCGSDVPVTSRFCPKCGQKM